MRNKPRIRFKGFTEDWEQRKLGEIVNSYSGGTPTASNKEYYSGDIPFIRSAEINSDSTELYITQKGLDNSSAKIVEKGTILYAMYGATSGEVGISKINGAINQAILAMIPLEYNGKIIAQYLRKNKESITGKYLQGGQGNLSANIILELPIQLPGLEESNQIANFLESFDTIITLHQRKLEKLKLAKKALLQKLFPKNGSQFPEIRFKGFTDAWEQRKLNDLVTIRRGLTYKPSDIAENGIRVLRSSNIDEDQFITSNDDVFVNIEAVNIPFAKNGDILITSANGSNRLVGKHTIISDIADNSAVHGGFMLLAESNNPLFTDALLSSNWYKRFINTYVAGGNGAIGNLSKSDLESQTVMIPSEHEQAKIGQWYDNINQLITLHQRKLDKLQDMKKGLLQKMFV